MTRFAPIALISLMVAGTAGAAEPGPTSAVVLTGVANSIFATFGDALCVQAQTAQGISCETRESEGWQDNLLKMEEGLANFSLLPSDRLAETVPNQFAPPVVGELRAVLALPSRVVTILARPDAGIAVANDLRGKRVRTAPPRALGPFLDWLRIGEWGEADFAHFGSMGFENSVNVVCANDADAFVFLDGHPSEMTEIAQSRCPLVLVPLADAVSAKVLEELPEFAEGTIPAGTYQGQDTPVPTLGGYTMLAALASVPDDLVERWLRAILDHYGEVQVAHSSIETWPVARLRPRSSLLPLHPGAEKVFAEKGLLPR